MDIMKLMTKINLFLYLITLSGVSGSYAQSNLAILEFEDAICLYKGYYDPEKFKEEELIDTYALVDWILYFDGSDLEELEANYLDGKSKLQALKLVRVRAFSDARDSMLRYIDESYAIQRIRLQAQDDPAILLSVFQDNDEVKYYAEALNKGGDSLLEAYKSLTKKQMEQNADPEALWRRYLAHIKSEDRYALAFDQVLTYGWWNQVNRIIYHYPNDGSLWDLFLGLFERVVSIDCDDV